MYRPKIVKNNPAIEVPRAILSLSASPPPPLAEFDPVAAALGVVVDGVPEDVLAAVAVGWVEDVLGYAALNWPKIQLISLGEAHAT